MNNTHRQTANVPAPAMAGIGTLFGLIKGEPLRSVQPGKSMEEFQKYLAEIHGSRITPKKQDTLATAR